MSDTSGNNVISENDELLIQSMLAGDTKEVRDLAYAIGSKFSVFVDSLFNEYTSDEQKRALAAGVVVGLQKVRPKLESLGV